MAEASPADASGGPHPAPYDQRTEIFNGLIKRGLNPQQAMGVLYATMGRSSTALDPNAIGDGGKSRGFGQWNGDRFANLQSTAAGMNTTWNDPRAQVQHFFNEVDGPYSKELANVKANATTAADATNLWTGSASSGSGYERPATNNWQQRYIQGSQAGQIDPQTGAPTWSTGPAAPLPKGAPVQGPNQPAAATATAAPPDTRSPAQKFADAAKKGDVGGALGALAGTDGKGPLSNVADAMKGAPAPSGQSSMLQPEGDNQGAQAQAGQALLGQVMQQAGRPLSWSAKPFGAGEAGQSTSAPPSIRFQAIPA